MCAAPFYERGALCADDLGGEELGLLCVEDTDEGAEFSEKDLAALMVVGQLLSLAVRHHLAAEALPPTNCRAWLALVLASGMRSRHPDPLSAGPRSPGAGCADR